MANDRRFVVKNGLQAQNLFFVSPNANANNIMIMSMLDNDTLSISGNTGQLFSISDSQSNTIFAVNDISGITSIEVLDTGTIRLAETYGSVAIGKSTPTANLDVQGTARANTFVGNVVITTSGSLNAANIADTSTAASHYFVEIATDGLIRPKTLADTQTEIVTAATVNAIAVISGSSSNSVLRYVGTISTAGAFDGGTTAPSGTTRLNYGGYLYATRFYGDGSNLTSIPNSATTAASANGASTIVARDAAGNFSANVVTATKFSGDGSTLTGVGATITDDVTTNATRYILFDDVTTGIASSIGVSSTKLYFNPSTGTMSATVFNSLSDINFKKDISVISNAVETVSKIDGVSFYWKENDKKSYGVIAQELEKTLPELVDGDLTKTVNYSGIIAFLINAVKELDSRIKVLEGK